MSGCSIDHIPDLPLGVRTQIAVVDDSVQIASPAKSKVTLPFPFPSFSTFHGIPAWHDSSVVLVKGGACRHEGNIGERGGGGLGLITSRHLASPGSVAPRDPVLIADPVPATMILKLLLLVLFMKMMIINAPGYILKDYSNEMLS